MREILFRGKAINRQKNKEYRTKYQNFDWVYGLLEKHEDDYSCATMINEYGISNIDIDENTLGQFTGFLDINGTKIFGGDIVKICGMVGKIVFEYGSFGIGLSKEIDYSKLREQALNWLGNENDNFLSLLEVCWNFNDEDGILSEIEVIGNIYDNPELLNT